MKKEWMNEGRKMRVRKLLKCENLTKENKKKEWRSEEETKECE